MERLNKHDISEIKKVFNSYNDETLSALAVTLSKLGLDCIDTIEAQQQEINLLIMEITELRESNQALKDYAENAEADKDEQAGTIMRLDNGLKKLRSSLQWLKETIRDLDYKAWAEGNIGKIDALLGCIDG